MSAVKVLVVLHDPPYGTERSYNGLRLAISLSKRDDVDLRVFLVGDAVSCVVTGQKTPNGYYNLERMLKVVVRRGGEVGCCGTCLDARGIDEPMLTEGSHRSSMDQLAEWTMAADKVVAF